MHNIDLKSCKEIVFELTKWEKIQVLKITYVCTKFLETLNACFPADTDLYLCRKAKEKRPLPRYDTFSVAHVPKLP